MNDNFEILKNDHTKFSASGGGYCKGWWKRGLIYWIECNARAAQERKRLALEKKKKLVEEAIELKVGEQQKKNKEKEKRNTAIIIASISFLSIGALIYAISIKETA